VLSFVVLCTGSTWWLAAGPARADTPPSNNDLPTISGIAQQGDVLTAIPGTWSGDEPISFSYQWSDGQTGSTATLSAADVAQSLTVAVTAWNAFGQASATSDSVGPILPAAPQNSASPQVTGTAEQGDILSVSTGTWSNDPTGFSYSWADCDGSGSNCMPIAGATSSSYVLQASDVGKTIVASVTASNGGGQASASSGSVGPVLPAAPVNSVKPAITGTVQQGVTLSVSNGTWSNNATGFAYLWEDCDGSGNNCAWIMGATSSSYTLQASDVGKTVIASVTASNAGGQGSASSGSVGPVLPAAPVNSARPAITGTVQQGGTLSVSNGTWSNNPTGFAYNWQDCDSSGSNCVAITGATSSGYTLQASDVGKTIVASVTASNAGGQNSSSSATSGRVLPAAPVASTAPGISGTAQQGKTLTVSNGAWGNNPTAFAYGWQDCDGSGKNCVAIAGATSSSYTPQASDVGKTIVASVTASNGGGQASASSSRVGPVLPAAPVNSVKPVIAGTTQQGATLNVGTGTWSNNPTAFAYVWQKCNSSATNCVAIADATSSSYIVQTSDVGSKILAVVTASNAGGQNAATSGSVGPVLPAAPVDTTAPGITGTTQQGNTLTVSNGAWNNNPTAFTYAWQDCGTSGATCSAIASATSTTYTLQGSDVGKYVSVTITASNSGGRTAVTTASVGPVLPPAPVNTQAPLITGTAEQGDTLSVSNGTWSNNPTGYRYVWESCNSSGANCASIGSATSSSYALSAADVGRTIACVVTATGAGGSASVTTTKTSVVVASPIPVASQPTRTDLLATPSAPVTNQSVTLVVTVSAGTSSTTLWGAVTFENGGAPIPGCANMPAAPTGTSATVACSTSFAASTAQLSAVFTPTSGSILKGSASPDERLTVAPDTTSTSLAASPSVNLGATTSYTATVGPPAARPGPVVPTGWVEFLDGGQPILPCASQPLSSGSATCAITYAVSGAHQITARYSGDANFTESSSPVAQVSAIPVPITVLGTITSTMQWNFYYSPKYTMVRNLVLNAALPGSTVVVRCRGYGCPFAQNATVLASSARCGRKARMCFTSGRFNLTPGFAGRRLAIGARITVNIVQPNWVGKSYSFTVRPRRAPRVQIGCLAPGGSVPGVGC
jgi:hypothetical protein